LRRAAAALVRLHGDDTLSFFKLRQDIHYLFDAEQQAFMAYRVEGGVLLCSGDPVGAQHAVPGLVRTALAFAEQRGLRLGAVGVSDDVARLFEQEGLRRFYLGDEAIVDTGTFSLEGRAIRKVRQSVRRLEQADYTFALTELGALSEGELRELESVTDTWLQGAPERGFAMAMDSVRGEHQFETLVGVARDDEGRVRGFLHFVPTYGRAAVSLSFMRRDPETPNGLTEYLVSRSLEAFRARDVDQVSLNFAAFARLVHDPQTRVEYWLGRVISLANPFFQIESLYRFNAKFSPRWVPRYLVYSGRLGLPRAGLAAAWAEGQLPKPFVRRP
jgi:lysyl-tRNA synthetase class 2